LGSVDATNVNAPFPQGRASLGFPTGITGAAANVHRLINNGTTSIKRKARPTTTGNTTTYSGLPVIGFAVVPFTEGAMQAGKPPVSVFSNYGGNLIHESSTPIQ
jgi:hypothetical protein